jgi:hypothetical protein
MTDYNNYEINKLESFKYLGSKVIIETRELE